MRWFYGRARTASWKRKRVSRIIGMDRKGSGNVHEIRRERDAGGYRECGAGSRCSDGCGAVVADSTCAYLSGCPGGTHGYPGVAWTGTSGAQEGSAGLWRGLVRRLPGVELLHAPEPEQGAAGEVLRAGGCERLAH